MRAQTARWVAGSMAAGAIALMAGGLALAYVNRHLVPADVTNWDFTDVFGDVVNLSIPVTGFVLAFKRPQNRIGWMALAAGLALGLNSFAGGYGQRALVAAPGSWPAGRAAIWLSTWIWPIPLGVVAFLFLLFPTGQLRSPRWRPAAWFVGGVFALSTVALLVGATRQWAHPFVSFQQLVSPPILAAMLVLFPAALVVSGAAVVVRFVRSSGDERLQLKWFAAAAVLVVATFFLVILTNSNSVPAKILNNLALLCLTAAIAIAILKYRLYDIDIVINKAVLYGSLAAFITVVYVGLVAGVGTLVGNRHSALLSALAATVVAVAFQPARQWAARLANRVVYGRRATPYQVLSDFARRIGGAYASEDVLPQMARVVAAGTGAERVVVWLRVGGELYPEASSDGGPHPEPLPMDGQAMPPLPDADVSVPVVYQGELLGAISIRMPRGEPLRPAGEQLVADVASQAGLALSNAGLVEDLRASRQRLVAAQDEERRRLERNLHDGAQQDLVALAIKLRLAGAAADEDAAQTKEIIGELQADAAAALENLRDAVLHRV